VSNETPVAWVVGASRGIGRAASLALAARGYRLALTSRSTVDLERVAEEVRLAGAPDVWDLAASVRQTHEIEAVVHKVRDRWERIDILVACAGVSPVYVNSENLGDEDWDSILDTNLNGAFRCCRAVFPVMKETGGAIVTISSVHGSVAGPRIAAYAASKGGLDALTRTLAVEWARHGIRVNAIAPGYVETAMTEGLRKNDRLRESLLGKIPLGRFATPDQIGAMVAALTDDRLGYVTGSVIPVDGGWTAQ